MPREREGEKIKREGRASVKERERGDKLRHKMRKKVQGGIKREREWGGETGGEFENCKSEKKEVFII